MKVLYMKPEISSSNSNKKYSGWMKKGLMVSNNTSGYKFKIPQGYRTGLAAEFIFRRRNGNDFNSRLCLFFSILLFGICFQLFLQVTFPLTMVLGLFFFNAKYHGYIILIQQIVNKY